MQRRREPLVVEWRSREVRALGRRLQTGGEVHTLLDACGLYGVNTSSMPAWSRLYRHVLLMARPSKSNDIFRCLLCPVTYTVGMVHNINIDRPLGASTSTSASKNSKVR